MQLPTTAQMVSEPLQAGGLWVYLAGLAIISAAILRENELGVRIGVVVLFASLVMFALNAVKVLAHFSVRKSSRFPLQNLLPYDRTSIN
jgi:hypothetical protein